MIVLLAAVTMMFAALTSAYVVRRGMSNDWVTVPVPRILFANTAALLASSAALEIARRRLRAGFRSAFNQYWTAGTVLGVLFLTGQAYAWQQLKAAGIYLASNPGSSFFYLFTATHGIHLLGGVAALAWVSVQALRLRLGPGKRTAVEVSVLYWHFLDALWIFLMALFLLWG
jgi:cytochrome c oxidase subunit 3